MQDTLFLAHQLGLILAARSLSSLKPLLQDWLICFLGNNECHKPTTQSFQQIPYALFKKRLVSKCAQFGICVQFIEESYTPQQCSSCGLLRKANRVKRGLYVCQHCAQTLNADINAAINIMRKVVPNALSKWDSGEISSPCRLRLVEFKRLNQKKASTMVLFSG